MGPAAKAIREGSAGAGVKEVEVEAEVEVRALVAPEL